MLVKTILVLASVTLCASSNHTLLDQMRADFIHLQTELWNYVLDFEGIGEKENQRPELHLVQKFEDYGDNLEKTMGSHDSYKEATQVLEGIWAYNVIGSDLKSIEALYGTFRRFQNLQTAPNKIPSPKDAYKQFAELVLFDPLNKVSEAFIRMEGVISNQFYRKVAEVNRKSR